MCAQLWTVVGLRLDIIGVAILFKWGPPQPNLEPGDALVTEGPEADENDRQKAILRQQYHTMSRIGLFLTGLGFVGQLIGALLG